MLRSPSVLIVLALLGAGFVVAAIALAADDGRRERLSPPLTSPPPAPERTGPAPPAADKPPRERIRWRRSVAVGDPAAGRLIRGVRLPSEGEHFYTWDPVKRRSPNRSWRRWGTDRLVRILLQVAREYHKAHPGARRMAIGDLSRPRGGDFGPQFGYIGHASHQNAIYVGPNTGLGGPPGVVQPLVNHDNHLHVRIP